MPAGGSAAGESGDRELVKVAYARDPVEGALVSGLLEDAGISCHLESSGMKDDGSQHGFGFLARGWGGGPQDVLVDSARAEEARGVVAQTLTEDGMREKGWEPAVLQEYYTSHEDGWTRHLTDLATYAAKLAAR